MKMVAITSLNMVARAFFGFNSSWSQDFTHRCDRVREKVSMSCTRQSESVDSLCTSM